MKEKCFDRFSKSFVRVVSLGKLELEKNPDFEKLDASLENKGAISDAATLIIIDDDKHEVVPRFTIKRSS